MSKTAVCVGEPHGQWPAGSLVYLLNQPFQDRELVVVSSLDAPDVVDPDVVTRMTLIYAVDGDFLASAQGASHAHALGLAGYRIVDEPKGACA